ncbi:hypothetical protein PDESU_02970 [Pontiella desulfatans]|uniref:Uncharacterized protein n=1 Tax=Pontiella desulfatans TaxID=2750659 RepID=A0A6C2U3N2_PONDE|nr:DUF6172 family protein [Pontiella desulfatans]VGO14409.1 hypothetical protein PDESU_02970 [Pontiella desulfatans]
MKKTFNLTHPKIKYPRMVEATKSELRRYIKRERRKALPEGVDFWDFDCKFGDTEATAEAIHLSEIDGRINDAEQRGLTAFYIEVLRKEGIRAKPEKENPVAKIELPKLKKFGEE